MPVAGEDVLVHPAEARRVGAEGGVRRRREPAAQAVQVLDHPRARPVEVGPVVEDHVHQAHAEEGVAAHRLRARHLQHLGRDRVGDLILDDLRGLLGEVGLDDDLDVAEVGERLERDRPDGPDAGARHEEHAEPHEEAVASGPVDDAAQHRPALRLGWAGVAGVRIRRGVVAGATPPAPAYPSPSPSIPAIPAIAAPRFDSASRRKTAVATTRSPASRPSRTTTRLSFSAPSSTSRGWKRFAESSTNTSWRSPVTRRCLPRDHDAADTRRADAHRAEEARTDAAAGVRQLHAHLAGPARGVHRGVYVRHPASYHLARVGVEGRVGDLPHAHGGEVVLEDVRLEPDGGEVGDLEQRRSGHHRLPLHHVLLEDHAVRRGPQRERPVHDAAPLQLRDLVAADVPVLEPPARGRHEGVGVLGRIGGRAGAEGAPQAHREEQLLLRRDQHRAVTARGAPRPGARAGR